MPAGFFGVRGFAGLFAVCFGAVGALLTWRRPGNPVGWIFAAAGLAEAVNFATFEYRLAVSAGHRLRGGAYAGWVQLWIWVPFIALITVYLFLLFPDGHLPGLRWRPVSWLAGGFTVIAVAGLALNPGSERPNLPALSNPFGVTPAAVPLAVIGAGLAGLLSCVVAVGAQPAGDRHRAAADQVAGLLREPGRSGPGARGAPVADPRDAVPDRRRRGDGRGDDDAGRRRGRHPAVPAV